MSDLEQLLDLIKRHREVGVLSALPITPDSVAVVVGSYKGDTIAFLRGLYDCVVYGFEPQEWAHTTAELRFAGDFKVHLFNYGLGTRAEEAARMYETGTDAASCVPRDNARSHGYGTFVDASDAPGLNRAIDLMVMNIEGYEYELVPHMIDHGLIYNIRRLLVQLHGDVALNLGVNAPLSGRLAVSHKLRWQHGNWQLWELNELIGMRR